MYIDISLYSFLSRIAWLRSACDLLFFPLLFTGMLGVSQDHDIHIHSCILKTTCACAHLGILGNAATLLTFRSFHEMPAPDSAKCISKLLHHCSNNQDWRYLATYRCFAPRQHVVILWPGNLFDCPGGVAWCHKHCCKFLCNLAEKNPS